MAEIRLSGTMLSDNGKFGFIKQDTSEENIFVIPGACANLTLPAIGCRVTYEVVTDQKTGRPRAESVQVEAAPFVSDQTTAESGTQASEFGGLGIPETFSGIQASESHGLGISESGGLAGEISQSIAGVKQTGTMFSTHGKYGFIKQDSTDENMFVLPLACIGFGSQLPPIGCRVAYDVGIDEKTGRPKALEVVPLDQTQAFEQGVKRPRNDIPPMMERSVAARYDSYPQSYGSEASGSRSGVMQTIVSHGKFGFILEDGGGDMFVIPSTCEGGVFPPIGARVTYDVVTDAVTGRPRAENVRSSAGSFSGGSWGDSWGGSWGATGDSSWGRAPIGAPIGAPSPRLYGPASFAGASPSYPSPRGPYGTKSYPAIGAPYSASAPASGRPSGIMLAPKPAPPLGRAAGVLLSDNGKFGFIQQDSGGENMFVMPSACQAFGGRLPPLGTRMTYAIVVDSKTGRPRAEEVAPEGSLASGYATGSMLVDNGKFGFIQQDSGEDNMFVMPKACASLGGVLPPFGARVGYEIVVDEKTGRPRAENVYLLEW